MKLKHTITEGGDEVDFDTLDKKQQNKIKAVQKAIGGQRLYIMETIHGLIAAFDGSRHLAGQKTLRFSAKDLSQLTKLKVRWVGVSASQQEISVGI